MFTPEYTRPAALGTTRALWQGVEFEKWTGGTATDGNEGSDDGNGGNAGGAEASMRIHLGEWRVEN